LSFPAAKHDDQVDALSLVGQLLDKMVVGVGARVKSFERGFDRTYTGVGAKIGKTIDALTI